MSTFKIKKNLKGGLIAPLFFFIFLHSCTPNIKPDINLLSAQVGLFNKFLIWQKYSDAERMVDIPLIKKIEDESKLKRFTEIKIIKIQPDPSSSDKATVILRREFYLLNDNRVKSELVKQVWKYQGKKKGWILISEEKLD